MDTGRDAGTASVCCDGPALFIDMGYHAVESNLRSLHDNESVTQPNLLVVEVKADYRGESAGLLERLKCKRG